MKIAVFCLWARYFISLGICMVSHGKGRTVAAVSLFNVSATM